MADYNMEDRLSRVKKSTWGIIQNKVGNILVGGEKKRQDDALANSVKTGDMAPDFELPDASGKSVSLNSLLAKGPAVLIWYRGAWCPYCNIALRYYQKLLPEFEKHNATLVAISPQLPDHSLTVQEKNNLAFPVLSDVNNSVGKQYGIVFPLGSIQGFLHNATKGIDKHNGSKDRELPLPATYIVRQDGEIIYDFLDLDYRNRAEPEEVLKALQM